jgi:hypothetical protein
MSQTLEAPAAPVAAALPAPATDQRSGQDSGISRPADGENQTRAGLRAELTASRRARRGQATVAQPKAGVPAETRSPASGQPTAAPAEGQATAGTDNSNAAPAPTQGATEAETLQNLATEGTETTDAAATATPTTTDARELLEDPEALEALSEEQIKAIKDASIRKLVRRNKRLTAQFREAEAQLAKRQDRPEPQENGSEAVGSGLDSHPGIRQLDQQIAQVDRILAWAEAHPDGGDYQDASGKSLGQYTAEQVSQLARNAQREVRRLEGSRAAKVERLAEEDGQVRAQAVTEARQAFPWYADKTSDEYTQASEILAEAPYLRQHPAWPTWLGDAIEGRKARLAKAASATALKPPARPIPPRVPPPAGSAVPKGDPTAKALAEAEAAFERTGKTDDLKRVQSLKRQMSRRGSQG